MGGIFVFALCAVTALIVVFAGCKKSNMTVKVKKAATGDGA